MPPLNRRQIVRGLAAGALAAPLPVKAKAPAGGFAADAAVLERALRALHPGLRRYNTDADLDAAFGRLRQDLGGAQSLGESWSPLSGFMAKLRCGHTFLNPTNQTGAAAAWLRSGQTRRPFAYRWLDGRMVATAAATAAAPAVGLAAGLEILTINAEPAPSLLLRLSRLLAADGHNDAKRRRLAELGGPESWPPADIFLPLIAPRMVESGLARLTVRGPDGRSSRVETPLLTREERVRGQVQPEPAKGNTAPRWSRSVLDGEAVLITMPT